MQMNNLSASILVRGPEARRAILFWSVVLIPLAFSRSFYSIYSVPKLGLIMLAVALVGGLRLAEMCQGAKAADLKRLWIPAAAFLLPLTIAWGSSPYRAWSLFGQLGRFQGLIPYLVIILFGLLLADAFRGQGQRVARALVLSASVMGAYHLMQYFGLELFPVEGEETINRVAVGTMGNPNFSGGFLAITLPVAAAFLLNEKNDKTKPPVALTLISGGLIVSFSQGAWAAALAGLAATAGIVLLPRWRFARWASLALVALIAAVAVGSIVASIVKPGHPRIPLTIQDRGRFWEQAGSMFMESPLVGRGPNAFAVEATHHRPPRDVTAVAAMDVADDPHSVFFAMLTSAGVLGGAGYLVAMAWVVRRGIEIGPSNVIAAGFFGGTIAYFVQSLASIDEVGLRVGFWIVLGGMTASMIGAEVSVEEPKAIKARGKGRKSAPKPQPLRNPVALGATALVTLAAVLWTGRFMLADVQVRSGIEAFTALEPFEGRDSFQDALNSRADYEYRNLYGFQSGLTAIDGGVEAGAPFARARDEAYEYLEHFPEVGAMRDYALLLARWEAADPTADDRAAELYLRAVTFDPINPLLSREAAEILVEVARVDDAEQVLEAHVAAAYPEADPAPLVATQWGQLAATFVEAQQVESAEIAIERALALDPAQAEALQAREVLDAADETDP